MRVDQATRTRTSEKLSKTLGPTGADLRDASPERTE
jgi:hypothetical protein